jgi:nucleotide-binding universal stress UspA family protein
MNPVVVPVDGSDVSLKALGVAADFAHTVGAKLVICHVVDIAKAAAMTAGNVQFVGGCLEALRDEGRSIVQVAADRVRTLPPSVETRVLQGSPVEEILGIAGEVHAAWIVMGSHGRTGLGHALLGSVAEGVLRHANVPVIIVPSKAQVHTAQKAAS